MTVLSFQNDCNHIKQDKIIKNDNQIIRNTFNLKIFRNQKFSSK